MLRAGLIAAAFLLIQGCSSIYVYPEFNGALRAEGVSGRLSEIVLGVEPNPNDFDYGWALEPKEPYDLQTLINALNEHQVFKKVAYVDQLTSMPDLILKNYRHAKPDFRGIHGERGGPLCVGAYFPISFLTLTVLPIYCSSEEEVTFNLSRPNDPTESPFRFLRYDKELIGVWAPVAATINPSWQSTSGRYDSDKRKTTKMELTKRYKGFIVKQFLELEPSIVSGVDTKNSHVSKVARSK